MFTLDQCSAIAPSCHLHLYVMWLPTLWLSPPAPATLVRCSGGWRDLVSGQWLETLHSVLSLSLRSTLEPQAAMIYNVQCTSLAFWPLSSYNSHAGFYEPNVLMRLIVLYVDAFSAYKMFFMCVNDYEDLTVWFSWWMRKVRNRQFEIVFFLKFMIWNSMGFNKPYNFYLRSQIKYPFIFLDLFVGYYISLIMGLSCEQLMVNL